jgi:hypothetical protein
MVTVTAVVKIRLGCSTQYPIIHDNLQLSQNLCKMVLKQLTDKHKQTCLQTVCKEKEIFLQQDVTIDERRVNH